MRIAVLILPIILLVFIAIPVMIGVYVYRDAKRRGMNAALWTLVAILAPSLIGFIIYLLVRGSYSNMRCSRCDTPIREDYLVCPNCGAKLQPTCSNCGSGVQPDWKVCPRCAQPLESNFSEVATPYRPKDRSLSGILIAIIVIPAIFIILMIMAFCGFSVFINVGSESNIDTSSVSQSSLAEFYDLEPSYEWEVVKSWIESLDKEADKAYALRYVVKEDSQTIYYYLVFMSSDNGSAWDGFGYSDKGFKKNFVMEFYDAGVNEQMLYGVEAFSEGELNLEIYFEDELVECEITDVDFNPACFWFDA